VAEIQQFSVQFVGCVSTWSFNNFDWYSKLQSRPKLRHFYSVLNVLGTGFQVGKLSRI